MIPKKHFDKVGAQAFAQSAPVGTGPYKFVEWKRDQYLKLERFEEHWRGQAPFKNLLTRVIPETSTQIAELKTGGVDIIRNLAPDLIPDLKAHPNTYVSTTPILRTHYVELDMRESPFNKKEVRQAANYAIDRQAIVEKLMGGLGQVVPTVINPMAFGYDPKVEGYGYDPKKAKELLKQAGFPNGTDITIHAGVSEAFFRQIAGARSTLDKEKRMAAYTKVQSLIKDEAPSIFLFSQHDMLGINKRVDYAARGDEWIWLYDAKLRK